MDFSKEIEKKEKMSLKKGSVQLPVAVWEYLDSKAISGIFSVAGIIRGYVLNGIRQTIILDIDKLSLENIQNIKEGLLKEIKSYLANKKANEFEGQEYKLENSYDSINKSLKKENVIEYFKENPMQFAEAKEYIKKSFLFINDAELIEIIGGGGY